MVAAAALVVLPGLLWGLGGVLRQHPWASPLALKLQAYERAALYLESECRVNAARDLRAYALSEAVE